DGKQRPLAIAALEDKIVQGACAMVLNAIYEEDFLGFSYGFRPGRGPHDALDALAVAITRRKVNHILDADIRDFFGSVNHDWLIRFLEHRIGDKRIIRLIRKWLKAGILEDGIVSVAESGTGQGSVISPLLANIYMHYVFDLLRQVVTGHFAYYAVPTNSRALSAFRHYVADLWRRTLRRRSQKDGFTWDRMTKRADGWLPAPRILHPWPDQRFAVKHPR